MITRSLVAIVAGITLVATACGSDDADSAPATGNSTQKEKSNANQSPEIVGLKAVGATKVEMDDDTIRAHFEGSVEDATAGTKCSAVEMAGDGREAVVVYADGDFVCADRYDD